MSLPLIMAGANMLSSWVNNRSQRSSLKKLRETTPSEREWMKRKQDIAKNGDPILQQQFEKNVGAIRQVGAENRQVAFGQAINQGLENSIIAHELRRKVDVGTQRSVATQARELAIKNAQSKRNADDELLQFKMGLEDRQRGINSQLSGLKSSALSSMAMAGLQGYTSAGGNFGINKFSGLTGPQLLSILNRDEISMEDIISIQQLIEE